MNTTTIRRILTTGAAAGVLSLSAAGPAAAWPDPGAPGSGDGGTTSDGGTTTVIREVAVDDDALEYVQIGLGVLAGMAVAGAAAVGVRRMAHHTPHPA